MSPKLTHLKVQTHSASHASTSHATFEIALATQWKIVCNILWNSCLEGLLACGYSHPNNLTPGFIWFKFCVSYSNVQFVC